MSYSLHKVLTDGTVVHEEFTKESWEAAGRDQGVARRWGHGDRCFDPVAEFLAGKYVPDVMLYEPPTIREVLGPAKPKKPEQGSFQFDGDE